MKKVQYDPKDQVFCTGHSGNQYAIKYSEEGDLYFERSEPPSAFLIYPPDADDFFNLLCLARNNHARILEENKDQYESAAYWRQKYFDAIRETE